MTDETIRYTVTTAEGREVSVTGRVGAVELAYRSGGSYKPATPGDEARDYYALCERARAVGVPTSLDDPASPRDVADLRCAVASAELSAILGNIGEMVDEAARILA